MDLTRSRHLFRTRYGLAATALLAALVAGACAPGAGSTPTAQPPAKAVATVSPAPSPAVKAVASPSLVTGPAEVMARQHPTLGMILTDGQGRTLYLFTRDEPNKSTCTGGCAQTWPPLLTRGQPTAGTGVTATLLSTILREDASTQVTYNRLPLYYFARDQRPGDTTGQGVGGNWFVVSPEGEAVRR